MDIAISLVIDGRDLHDASRRVEDLRAARDAGQARHVPEF